MVRIYFLMVAVLVATAFPISDSNAGGKKKIIGKVLGVGKTKPQKRFYSVNDLMKSAQGIQSKMKAGTAARYQAKKGRLSGKILENIGLKPQ